MFLIQAVPIGLLSEDGKMTDWLSQLSEHGACMDMCHVPQIMPIHL